MTLADPISDLVVCRQRLDVLEQQAKAAEEGPWWLAGPDGVSPADAEHIATWSPAAVLALCGWIRQTLDGAEQTLAQHVLDADWQVDHGQDAAFCYTDRRDWPCPDRQRVESSIAGLAAVLAEQAVK